MEQYKVILVDDEVEVIDIMKQKIRWNDLGFNVVGSATNGVKALELLKSMYDSKAIDAGFDMAAADELQKFQQETGAGGKASAGRGADGY